MKRLRVGFAASGMAVALCGVGLRPWNADESAAGGPITVPALAQELDLLAGGALDEWVWFSEANGATRESAATLKDGVLRVAGSPKGYLATRRWYREFAVEFDWRWPEGAGNSGLLVHGAAPLVWNGWPRCLEVQLRSGDAGDFILMGDRVGLVRGDETFAGAVPGGAEIPRRIPVSTSGAENEPGEWNTMRVELFGGGVRVLVNGTLVNEARDLTVREGSIGLQSEGTPIEFRQVRLLPPPSK